MWLNHLETIPHPQSMEKLSSMKTVTSAKVLELFSLYFQRPFCSSPWVSYNYILLFIIFQNHISFKSISSVQSLSCVQLFVTSWTAAHQVSLSITNSWSLASSCPLSQWCHPTISSSVIPFSSWLHSLPVSGSFLMSHFFSSGGQSTGVSDSASVLPMNTQDWSPLGWTGWISLQSKGLSRVFSNTTVQKHLFMSLGRHAPQYGLQYWLE